MEKIIDILLFGKWNKRFKIFYTFYFIIMSIWITNYFVNLLGYYFTKFDIDSTIAFILSPTSIIVFIVLAFVSFALYIYCSFFIPIISVLLLKPTFYMLIFCLFIFKNVVLLLLIIPDQIVNPFSKKNYDFISDIAKDNNLFFLKFILSQLMSNTEKEEKMALNGSNNIFLGFSLMYIIFKLYSIDIILPQISNILFYLTLMYFLNGICVIYIIDNKNYIKSKLSMIPETPSVDL